MTLPMKPGEPYQQFLARLDASYQKLREQDVELNATVRDGPWLHASEEATVGVEGGVHDTATKGSMSYKEIVEGTRAIFPERKGSTSRTKEVFQAEECDPTGRSSADSDQSMCWR